MGKNPEGKYNSDYRISSVPKEVFKMLALFLMTMELSRKVQSENPQNVLRGQAA